MNALPQDPGPMRRWCFTYLNAGKRRTIEVLASSREWACFTCGFQLAACEIGEFKKDFALNPEPVEMV